MTGTAAAAIAAGDGPATPETAAKFAPPAAAAAPATGQGHTAGGPAGVKGAAPAAPSLPPNTAYDLSLEHPRCVFQLMKKHFSRYTPEMVSSITGIPTDKLTKAWDMYTSIRKDGDTKKVGTIIYSVGWTQHTFGSQIIRTAAMTQLLLGNVGRAGGGVNALRGHSNIQGATDLAGVFDILPGYLKVPMPTDTDFDHLHHAHYAQGGQAERVGFVQLLVQYAQICRFFPEGDVRRRRQEGERLGLPLPAQD